jgi:demethylmenaquinone methyltransferase/2-methoxy-6-polyprenyl-1,4-benzoquinol methylase
MSHLTGVERARYVRRMFGRIAGRYDLMNRLMTGGQDVRWRKIVVAQARLPAGGRLLDLGTGTGDLAAEALGRDGALLAVGGDFTLEMMRAGRHKADRQAIRWAGVDALNLPFPDESFDAVTSGFLMRNVTDVPRALSEQFRVLRSPDPAAGRPGGRIVCLDTTPPPRNWMHPGFLTAEALAACLSEAGFREVTFRRLMLGTVAIHVGAK